MPLYHLCLLDWPAVLYIPSLECASNDFSDKLMVLYTVIARDASKQGIVVS